MLLPVLIYTDSINTTEIKNAVKYEGSKRALRRHIWRISAYGKYLNKIKTFRR